MAKQETSPGGGSLSGIAVRARRPAGGSGLFAALDLGTNSCRMLIARPKEGEFEVVDAFSKAVFLGRGLESSGCLSRNAVQRTLEALKICKSKINRNRVESTRLVTTAACRQARNSGWFLQLVRKETGLELEIIDPEEEARLAVIGCAPHVSSKSEQLLIVDIGGGSTELVRIDLSDVAPEHRRTAIKALRFGPTNRFSTTPDTPVRITDWISIPLGVSTLNGMYSDIEDDAGHYALMSCHFEEMIWDMVPGLMDSELPNPETFQIIGTSGTITTLAASHLGLKRYQRDLVDGLNMSAAEISAVVDRYLRVGPKGRLRDPCVGKERLELIMAGSAILQSILRVWPTEKLTVADRGLREGMLYSQMAEAGVLQE
jgi:exopolyphosphatase/guanosine-5'-triphosphate,3'-diphosphate pyrophosphatase